MSGTTTFGVPKSALRNVSTVEQWAQVLTSNNFPSPSPDDSASPSPAPSASCAPGEDRELGQWLYTCDLSGDITILGEASSITDSGNLLFDREANQLVITQTSTSGSEDIDNPFSLTGVSLMFTTTTIKLPGTVGEVTGSARKIDENTVEFTADENQKSNSTATITLSGISSTATSLDLTTKPSSLFDGSVEVQLIATLGSPAEGLVEFFDGSTSLGLADQGAEGVFTLIASGQTTGAHTYKAVFRPKNWWSLDKSKDETSVNFKTFKFSGYPSISGIGKVGSKLSIANFNPSPTSAKIAYQWLRNNKAIPGGTKSAYKLSAADYKKYISVRIVVTKSTYLPLTVITNPIAVTKR
ncbi:MAG: hypothetical protein EBS36_04180 [Actinobacteria bacterium]|nr:hypothetical protein [Actinomycetota bacterium]NBY15583.1 hypothetical protein [Actinomycetota bacterium]